MRRRPCTSRVSRAIWRRGWNGHAPPWSRERRAKPCESCGMGTRSVLPNDPHHHALNHHVALVDPDGGELRVGRLQPDPPARLTIVLLDGGAPRAAARDAVQERHDRLAVVGLVALLDHDVVT